MKPLLASTLQHLQVLVSFDTRNPPRKLGTGGIFDYLRAQLQGFDISVTDHGAGAVSLFAVRGGPRRLFNVHLDTVPDSPNWSADPFALRVAGGRATGLGACDIKGAAAGLLAVAGASDGALALLFSTDEEGADPRCIRTFLDTVASRVPSAESRVPSFTAVVVAEPTRCKAVAAHRGIQSVRARFRGRAGHASVAQKPGDSAVHQAVRWGSAALDFAAAQEALAFGGLRGLPLNLGRIDGGIKPNMIAADAELRLGIRLPPSMDPDALLARLAALTEPAPATLEETFRGPPLPAHAAGAARRLQEAHALAADLGIPAGEAVDFWTEAALFSQAGFPAIVFGPGDIAQAHGADEWVALDDLRVYADTVLRAVTGGRA